MRHLLPDGGCVCASCQIGRQLPHAFLHLSFAGGAIAAGHGSVTSFDASYTTADGGGSVVFAAIDGRLWASLVEPALRKTLSAPRDVDESAKVAEDPRA